jgi:exosortase
MFTTSSTNNLSDWIPAKSRSYILGLSVLATFIGAFFPAFRLLFEIWMKSEEYGHAFLTIPIIFYMVWAKRIAFASGSGKYGLPGLALAIIFTVIYIFAILTQVNTFIFMSMYLTVIGSLIYLSGPGIIKVLATPLLLFLLLIPIPEQLYPQLTFPLQLKVSQASEIIIRQFSVPLLREGNVMHIPQRSFEVVEACSGLRSVMSLLTLSIIMGYFMMRRITSKVILFAASIPTAIFVNIVRITFMILLFYHFKMDLTKGALHTATGFLVFLLAILTLFLLQRMLERWETKKK